MKDENYFEEKVDEVVEIRMDLKEVYNPKLSGIKKIYKTAFDRDPKELKDLIDFEFFQNGIPKPDAEAKLSVFLDKFVKVCQVYKYIGKESKIVNILSNNGITLTIDDTTFNCDMDNNKFLKAWNKTFDGACSATTGKELIEMLLTSALEQMKGSQELKDEVIGHSEKVEAKCDISKGAFGKAVDIKQKKSEGKDAQDVVDKLNKTAQEIVDITNLVG